MANTKYAYVRNFELPDPLLPGTFLVFRLDGHSFHRFSDVHNFTKPNDVRALQLMDHAAKDVMEAHPDIMLAFGESDEYSFLLKKSTSLFNRRESKINSTLTSEFTSSYVYNWSKYFPDLKLQYPPSFDGRVVLYPHEKIVKDYFAWRQADTHINNLYNTTFWALVLQGGQTTTEAHATLRGTYSKDKHEILYTRFKINYNMLDARFRKGSVLVRSELQDIESSQHPSSITNMESSASTNLESQSQSQLQSQLEVSTSTSTFTSTPASTSASNASTLTSTPPTSILQGSQTQSPPPCQIQSQAVSAVKDDDDSSQIQNLLRSLSLSSGTAGTTSEDIDITASNRNRNISTTTDILENESKLIEGERESLISEPSHSYQHRDDRQNEDEDEDVEVDADDADVPNRNRNTVAFESSIMITTTTTNIADRQLDLNGNENSEPNTSSTGSLITPTNPISGLGSGLGLASKGKGNNNKKMKVKKNKMKKMKTKVMKIELMHCDIIKDEFWDVRPWLLED